MTYGDGLLLIIGFAAGVGLMAIVMCWEYL